MILDDDDVEEEEELGFDCGGLLAAAAARNGLRHQSGFGDFGVLAADGDDEDEAARAVIARR